jgi:Tfp pilus assembly protein PilF
MSPAEAFPRARAAAAKAVELDPNSAEAHNSLAFATFWGSFGAASAEQEFKRAIELDPNLPRAHHWYATFLNQTNRPQEALSEIERARQLDPSSTPILADKGFILAQAGKVEEAKALLMQIAQSRPDFVHPHQYLASIYFQEGDYEAYFAEFKMAAKLRHDQKLEQAVENEQSAYAFGGLPVMLKQRLDMAQQSFREGRGAAFDVADAYAALGEYDDAMKYLKIASQRREFPLITVTLNANFRPLQGNPEFREIVAKIGLPPIR